MNDHLEIILQIHCHNLRGSTFGERTAVRLGVQKGKDVVGDVPGDATEVTFTIPLRVQQNPQTGKPNFLGPFAHGTPEERFIYLSLGERKVGEWEMFRRAKIHLNQLALSDIEAVSQAREPITVSINMTDDRGGSRCASIKGNAAEWKASKKG